MNIMELRVKGLLNRVPINAHVWFYAQKSKRPHASYEPKSLRDA